LMGNIYGDEIVQKLTFADTSLPKNHSTKSSGIQSVEDMGAVSTGYTLFQNYPNPVSEKTSIGYSLPVSSYIKLKVYDICGRTIKTLIEGQQNEGTYRVIWDCRDANGERITPGIYFHCLTAGDFTESKKMIVIE